MKFENTQVGNFEGAIRSMRMPLMSHAKSDSYYDENGNYIIGEADMDLAKRLCNGGDPHSKFLRTIYVDTIIKAPSYITAELDTYKIGTVRNSSSLQHTGAKKDFTIEDFAYDGETAEELDDLLDTITKVNKYRRLYEETKDYKYFRLMRQLMPMGYEYTFSFSTNYAQLHNMWYWRVYHPHRLKEWTVDFAQWIDSLPYADELIKFAKE